MCFSIQVRATSLCLRLMALAIRLCASRMRVRACGTRSMICVSVGASNEIERRLRQGEHLVAAGGGHRREEIDHGGHGGCGVGGIAPEAWRWCAPGPAVARRCAARPRIAPPRARWPSWLPTARDRSHRSGRARGSRPSSRAWGSGRVTRKRFSPRPRPSSPCVSNSRMASRMVERLTPNCRARSVSEGSGSPARSARPTMRCSMSVRDLPVSGMIVQGLEQIASSSTLPRTARARSACGGSPRCRRRSRTAWHRAAAGRSGSR